jgi:hypothetical protein
MIDDPRKTDLLIAKLREWLPFAANITECLARTLEKQSPEVTIPKRCNVVDILNSGDMGGILCCLDIGGPQTKAAHVVSITHLSFDRRLPFSREIKAYQHHRIKKLKQERGRD